tara:strand:+ start:110 stop:475 length:366 start_codon:yes stop_codon:yes gene_type:complete
MRICFDLDGTLCRGSKVVDGVTDYSTCEPLPNAAQYLQATRGQGHTVIIQTARGMSTAAGRVGVAQKNIGLLTLQQLADWGFEYDEIYFGKPSADLYVDDKGVNAFDYWSAELEAQDQLWR